MSEYGVIAAMGVCMFLLALVLVAFDRWNDRLLKENQMLRLRLGEQEDVEVRIRITRKTVIPLLDVGKVYDAQTVTECGDEKIYFIHHAGNYLGIRARDCEEIEEEAHAK